MKSDTIDYIKNDKIYRTKKTWQPKRVRVWLILPLLLLTVLGGYVGFSAIGMEQTGLTEYKVKGEIDYKVYLKDNDYYAEKYLGPGMQYIVGLISVVRADFHYMLEADEDMNAHYEYEIIATVKATDKADKSKVLYEKTDILKTSKIADVKNDIINIADNVDIDYAKYSDYLKNFRSEFGIAANCFLDLKMVVKVDGAVKTEDTLAMNIPLSDATLDIVIDTQALNRTEQVGEERQNVYVKNLGLLVASVVMVMTGVGIIIIIIGRYATRYNHNPYEKELNKILKEYDTYIVEANNTIYELENVVRVPNFKELLDASNAENMPIVFLEVVPGEKAYFVVNGANTTYRYTLSRAYQERMAVDE